MGKFWLKIFLCFYFVYYLFLTSIVISVFLIYRPFVYVDNIHSYVICNNDGGKFEIGPNFIYTFNSYLDRNNDSKARKLCEYRLIRDYTNTINEPEKRNYVFYPVTIQESGWINALLVSITTFIIGTIIIETVRIIFFISVLRKDFVDNYFNFGSKILKLLNGFIN